MNNESPQFILEGPKTYIQPGKEIKNVVVQEADLVRLKDHLDSINDISVTLDCFNLFFGATITSLITAIVEWASKKQAPVLYLIMVIVCLSLSFYFYYHQSKKSDLGKAQHLLNESKKDLNTIFSKANIAMGKASEEG